MSNYTSKAKVSVAQTAKKSKFDLSHSHITTTDFYCPRPSTILELEPNCSVKLDMTTMVRLSPLVEPMYGDIKVVNRAFFVPMRTIMAHWNEFITNAPCIDSEGNTILINSVPTIAKELVQQMFGQSLFGLSYNSTASTYDFMFRVSGNNVKKNLTNKGKAFLNILNSLGYQIDLNNTGNTGSSVMSALPLYAFARVCYDWTRNAAYDNFQFLQKFFEVINTSSYNVNMNDLNSILDACYRITYGSDYFTSAWDNPMSPNNSTISTIQLNDPVSGDPIMTTPNGALALSGSDGEFSHLANMLLHKLQDWLTRKQIAGSRSLDRYMSEFGVQLESSKLNRSVYLGKQDVPIAIMDVTQTSPDVVEGNSSAQGVGNYSGKGIGNQSGSLCHFTTDEFGYLLVISYVEPRVSYPFGRDRMIMHRNPLDFYTPEFDGVGTQAIRQDELVAGFMQNYTVSEYRDNGVFGFTPRFAEYKVKHDRLTGDFCYGSRNTSLQGWYLFRKDISPDHIIPSRLTHDLEFTMADPASWNNIFFDNEEFNDHFFVRFIFNVEKYSHIKPLYDFYQFEDESRTIQQDVNGTNVTA